MRISIARERTPGPGGLLLVGLLLAASCGDDTDDAGAGGAGGASGGGGALEGGSAPDGAGGTGGDPDGPACGPDADLDRSPASGTWSERAPLPAPRQETAVVALDGLVYVLGGFTLTGTTDLAEVYDPVADSWAAIAPLPVELHHANAAAVSGKIYVLGHLSGGAFDDSGAGYAYDPVADAWSAVAPMPAGTERGAAAVGVIGERAIVAGGFRDLVAVDDASLYDSTTDSWQALPPLPAARDHGVGAVVDGVFYAIGGREGAIESQSARLFAFDPELGAWCERASMPTARGGIAAAVLGGEIVVVGGEGNQDDPSGVFTSSEVFDPAANRWRIESPLPVGRHGTGAAAIGSTLYLPGGADQQAFGAVSTATAFEL